MSTMSDDATEFRAIPQTAAPVPAQTRSPGQPAVMIEGLTKRFGAKVAVDNLTMWVPRGSMFGFVGPNGAGKTTTLSMVTGCCVPTPAGWRYLAMTSGPIRLRLRLRWASCLTE